MTRRERVLKAIASHWAERGYGPYSASDLLEWSGQEGRPPRRANVRGPGRHLVGGACMGNRTCSLDGCEEEHAARGYCLLHYTRLSRQGAFKGVPPPRKDRRALFWAKVDKHGPVPDYRPDLGPCWIWTGTRVQDGYGNFWLGGRSQVAHRFAYELLVGPVPEGLELDHLCRVRACVRPTHLEPVTHRENGERGFSPSALAGRATHCPNGHPYDEANMWRGARGRNCRTCFNARRRRYRAGLRGSA